MSDTVFEMNSNTQRKVRNTMNFEPQFKIAIEQLEKRNNVSISFALGASVLTLESGQEVWLEADNESHLLVLHTEVKEKACFEKRTEFWQKCLELNAQISTLNGFWLGLNKESNTLRLCVAIPKEFINVDVLDKTLLQAVELADGLERKFLSQAKVHDQKKRTHLMAGKRSHFV